MLQNISWSQYWLAIILTNLAYYLFVWMVYFKGSISFVKTRVRRFHEGSNSGTDTEDITIILHDLGRTFENRNNKNELILALKNKIQSYQEIDDPGFRDSINRFIVSEGLAKCSIRLEEDDLKTLWK